jgi:NTE family protein
VGHAAVRPQPLEVDGQPYWEGGYLASPAVFPLVYGCASRDVLLVLHNPLQREGTPGTAQEIETRMLEPAFSLRLHMIDASDVASLRRTETQVRAYGPFLQMLRAQGRERAVAWPVQHADSVARQSTIDLRQRAV